jgi:putative hemolysin
VVDEFGGMEGIITMEDILEEIVGDIRDEYDEEEQEFDVLPDGSVLVEGMMNIADFNTSVDFSIPESEDYDTVAGFVTTVFGRIPDPGDHLSVDYMDIEVLEVEEHRVRKVRLLRHRDAAAEPAE